MNQGQLHRYFLNNSQKLIHKWAHYFDIYERHLARFVNTSPTLLEIGVYQGGSLAMWKNFLGQGCQIAGIDINPDCIQHQAEGIDVFTGSQDDPEIINDVLKKYPQIDIVIDDGSHVMSHMIDTFNMLYHKVNPYGVYIVEDVHTCYWPEYGGGLKRNTTFMEFAKDKIDELNALHTRGASPVSDFTRETDYITFYDSMVVFERRPQAQRQDIKTQGMP
jgi:cephalosporin hydroxylase